MLNSPDDFHNDEKVIIIGENQLKIVNCTKDSQYYNLCDPVKA